MRECYTFLMLEAQLLGQTSFSCAGEVLEVRSKKALAMLAYLCQHPDGASREALALLLWESGKLGSVRQALYELRKLPGVESWLVDEPERVRVKAVTDAARFETAWQNGRTDDAVALYSGTFLNALIMEGAPNFTEWLLSERERLASTFSEAQFARLETLEGAERFEDALSLARTVLAVDDLNESAHRAAMRLEHRAGRPEAAVEQFEVLREILRDQLGVEPLPETLALLGDIENARSGGMRRALLLGSDAVLPGEAEHFIGRSAELARAEEMLSAGSLLVHGFGGVGKTAFAAELAKAYAPEGVLWLEVGADSPEDAASALAAALGGEKRLARRRGQDERAQQPLA